MAVDIKYTRLTQSIFERKIIEEKASSILVFGASWSGNAEIMDSMIERISQEQEYEAELQFFKVDIEEQTDISQFFGVVAVPTIIMLKNGEILEVIKGLVPARLLRKSIRTVFFERQMQKDR